MLIVDFASEYKDDKKTFKNKNYLLKILSTNEKRENIG